MPITSFIKKRILNSIIKAAKEHRTIKISYTDVKNVATFDRECEPYEIKGDGIYMFDLDKQSIRLFKLSNIDRAVLTNNTFTPRWPIQIEGGL